MKAARFVIITLVLLAGAALLSYFTPLPQVFLKNDQTASPSEPLRVSIITDLDHCPQRFGVNEEWLERFLSDARNRRSDFIVSLGDNASHGLRECSATGDADARYIAERLRSAGLPTHMVLGDHDIENSVASYQAWLATISRPKTYYSFTVKDVRVVILDTVLGGESMSPPCEELAECRSIVERQAALDTLSFEQYRAQYPGGSSDPQAEKKRLRNLFEEIDGRIKNTRSTGRHDKGQVGEEQLAWLERELAEAKEDRVLILSDHPLFDFTSHRKRYNITNGEQVRAILKASKKDVVAISGEAHLWHEEVVDGIPYYIVDAFKDHTGPTAFFSWPETGHSFEKIIY